MDYALLQTLFAGLALITPVLLYIFKLELDKNIKAANNSLRDQIYTALENSEKERDRELELLRNTCDRRWDITKDNFKKLEESSVRKNQRTEFNSQKIYEQECDTQELIAFLKKKGLDFYPKQRRFTSYEKWKTQIPNLKDTLNMELDEEKIEHDAITNDLD